MISRRVSTPGLEPVHRRALSALAVIAALTLIVPAGCSTIGEVWDDFFGSEEEIDPFEEGLLSAAAFAAPPGSTSQYLAQLAKELEWEEDVTHDLLLREAVIEEKFSERVEPRLLGLFFRKGFSVLPILGEGHEFNRDTLVRGDLVNSRYLVRTKIPIRIIFLGLAENIVIIYPIDGVQPQVFNRTPASTVAVRESRLERYLN